MGWILKWAIINLQNLFYHKLYIMTRRLKIKLKKVLSSNLPSFVLCRLPSAICPLNYSFPVLPSFLFPIFQFLLSVFWPLTSDFCLSLFPCPFLLDPFPRPLPLLFALSPFLFSLGHPSSALCYFLSSHSSFRFALHFSLDFIWYFCLIERPNNNSSSISS